MIPSLRLRLTIALSIAGISCFNLAFHYVRSVSEIAFSTDPGSRSDAIFRGEYQVGRVFPQLRATLLDIVSR